MHDDTLGEYMDYAAHVLVLANQKDEADAVIAELDRALNQLHKGDRYECPWTKYWWQKTLTGYEWGMG